MKHNAYYTITHTKAEKKNLSWRKRLVAGILFTLSLTNCLFLSACAPDPFRLHVIANSNTARDQEVKLMVRDALLAESFEGMEACHNKEEAHAYAQAHLEELTQTANRVLKEQGMPYRAQVLVGEADFPEKTYGDVTYPAGRYDALRVILGEGKGENWWCVLFPPLCIVNTQAEPQSGKEVEYRSALFDWIQKLFAPPQTQNS